MWMRTKEGEVRDLVPDAAMMKSRMKRDGEGSMINDAACLWVKFSDRCKASPCMDKPLTQKLGLYGLEKNDFSPRCG